MSTELGARLRELRGRRGWSQHHLSRTAGVSSRTIQRIEEGDCRPRSQTLQALAAAFETDVSRLLKGFTEQNLSAFEEAYLCPRCGAPLEMRTFVDHEYGDTELEVFACGHTRGWSNRPCPKDPSFPKFEDYELTFQQEGDGSWWCFARGTMEEARQVELQSGCGLTREDAERMVKRSYILARDGYDAAKAFMPI
jgi:transcriptional regulator with XRE-family HTH domain